MSRGSRAIFPCAATGNYPGDMHPEAPALSKTRFMAGLQCLKRLYLECYDRALAAPIDAFSRAVLEAGQAVGAVARQRFPGGVLIDPHLEQDRADEKTRAALEDRTVPAIYEAALCHKGVRIRADVLVRQRGGRFDRPRGADVSRGASARRAPVGTCCWRSATHAGSASALVPRTRRSAAPRLEGSAGRRAGFRSSARLLPRSQSTYHRMSPLRFSNSRNKVPGGGIVRWPRGLAACRPTRKRSCGRGSRGSACASRTWWSASSARAGRAGRTSTRPRPASCSTTGRAACMFAASRRARRR
jgi:hypothetical protein